MVLDPSALLALLLDEPDAEQFRLAVDEDATRLVVGDAFAYALSRASGEPPLFKGGGFAQTDVARRLP